MSNSQNDKKLSDILAELWSELHDKLFGSEKKPQLKPIPVRDSDR